MQRTAATPLGESLQHFPLASFKGSLRGVEKREREERGEGQEGTGRRVDVDSLMKSGCQTA